MANVSVMVLSSNKKEHENQSGRDVISAVESFIFTILRFELIIPIIIVPASKQQHEYAAIPRLILLITFAHRKSIHI